jgi:hypothetical protein
MMMRIRRTPHPEIATLALAMTIKDGAGMTKRGIAQPP